MPAVYIWWVCSGVFLSFLFCLFRIKIACFAYFNIRGGDNFILFYYICNKIEIY